MRVQLCSTSTIGGNKCSSFVIESAVIPQLNSGIMMVLFWFVHSFSLIIMFFLFLEGLWNWFVIVLMGINLCEHVGVCVVGNNCMYVFVNKAKVQIAVVYFAQE